MGELQVVDLGEEPKNKDHTYGHSKMTSNGTFAEGQLCAC